MIVLLGAGVTASPFLLILEGDKLHDGLATPEEKRLYYEQDLQGCLEQGKELLCSCI